MITTLFFLNFVSGNSWVMAVGETRLIPAPQESQMWIADKTVLRGRDLNDVFAITAAKTGETLLRIRCPQGSRSYKVTVFSKRRKRQWGILKAGLVNSPKAFLRWDTHQFEVHGRLSHPTQWQDIQKAITKSNARLYLRTQFLNPHDFESWVAKQFTELALPVPKLILTPFPRLAMPGSSPKGRVQKLASSLGIEVDFLKSRFLPEQQVRIEIELAEVSRSLQQSTGMSWPHAVSAQIIPEIQRELLFEAMQNSAHGRILAQPSLFAKSGSTARLHSGGQIPIRNKYSHNVSWKDYGLSVEVSPQIFRENIDLKIKIEISSLDGGNAHNGAPAIKRSLFSTHLQSRSGATHMISGLLQSQKSKDQNGLIFLQDIPLLAPLFGSQRFRESLSELLIFLTPKVSNDR